VRLLRAACAKNAWPAELDEEVAAYVHNDGALLAEVAALRDLYRAPDDPCFLHTDTWTGNVLVDAGGGMTTIDYEFGQLGPPSYDIGHVLCVGIMSALTVQTHEALEAAGMGVCQAQTAGLSADALAAARRQQLAWLVRLPTEAWAAYETESAEQADGRPLPPSRLADALGYAGITILRWSLGEFNLFTMLGLPEDCGAARLAAVRRAVYLGTALIRRRRQLCSMEAVQQLLECALTWDAQGPVPAALAA
jgi:5-methylthioribose kinase